MDNREGGALTLLALTTLQLICVIGFAVVFFGSFALGRYLRRRDDQKIASTPKPKPVTMEIYPVHTDDVAHIGEGWTEPSTAYLLGAAARRDGHPVIANPYLKRSQPDEYLEWLEGWTRAVE